MLKVAQLLGIAVMTIMKGQLEKEQGKWGNVSGGPPEIKIKIKLTALATATLCHACYWAAASAELQGSKP